MLNGGDYVSHVISEWGHMRVCTYCVTIPRKLRSEVMLVGGCILAIAAVLSRYGLVPDLEYMRPKKGISLEEIMHL